MKKHIAATLLSALFLSAPSLANAGTLNVFTSDHAGFDTHSVWYDDGQEIVVIDSQFTPAHAEALLAEIRAKSRSPVTRVVVTHPNPDKFNGLSVFHRLGIESLASRHTAAAMPGVDAYKRHFWVNMAKAFSAESYPKFEPARTTFAGEMTIRLKSGESLTLIELPHPGISSTQTVVRIDQSGDLIVGDLVHARHHAWLEGGIVEGKPQPDLAGWRADLQALPRLGQGRVFGGRGVALPVNVAVAEQIHYLDTVEKIVDAYLLRFAGKRGVLSDPQARQGHYQAIQREVAQAFPDYAFPEMIGYSIYGLFEQKLSAQRGAGESAVQ